MIGRNQILKILLTYPFTWLAVIVIVGIEWAFNQWFHPPLLLTLLMVGLGMVMLAVWPILFLKSPYFRQHYNQMPYETDLKELEKTLASCSEAFRKPAQECLALLAKIRREFHQAATFQAELDRIFQNLFDLSRNHGQFYARTKEFGSAQQKQTMQNVLQQQVLSVENSLTALKTFSGNLTLLDTHPEEYNNMGNDLKTINQGLQNVIQEV
jgi:hypothetical protein